MCVCVRGPFSATQEIKGADERCQERPLAPLSLAVQRQQRFYWKNRLRDPPPDPPLGTVFSVNVLPALHR